MAFKNTDPTKILDFKLPSLKKRAYKEDFAEKAIDLLDANNKITQLGELALMLGISRTTMDKYFSYYKPEVKEFIIWQLKRNKNFNYTLFVDKVLESDAPVLVKEGLKIFSNDEVYDRICNNPIVNTNTTIEVILPEFDDED